VRSLARVASAAGRLRPNAVTVNGTIVPSRNYVRSAFAKIDAAVAVDTWDHPRLKETTSAGPVQCVLVSAKVRARQRPLFADS
jgi:hypothetical protein